MNIYMLLEYSIAQTYGHSAHNGKSKYLSPI